MFFRLEMRTRLLHEQAKTCGYYALRTIDLFYEMHSQSFIYNFGLVNDVKFRIYRNSCIQMP